VRQLRRFAAAILLIALAGSALADVFRPAYLEFRQVEEQQFRMTWKVPALGPDRRLAAYVVLPPSVVELNDARSMFGGDAWTEQRDLAFPGGIAGTTIRIEGSAVGVTDVVARVEWLDGSTQVERLPFERPLFTVAAPAGRGEIAWTYLVLGVEHILAGLDHLLFVLALLLLVRGVRSLVATITAFTLAHSLTLVAATLGWVHVPGPPVEAIIALSIVFVAAEVLHGLAGRPGLTARAPWVVALSFGLLHGLGFAGALAEVGLPDRAIPLALLTFNVGVEVGQLIFVAAMLMLGAAGRTLAKLSPGAVSRVLAYGIGSIAAFWTIERVVAFVPA